MKQKLMIALGLVALMLAACGDVAGASQEKVTICHVAGRADDPANVVTLTLAWPAVFGEAGHFYENGTPRAGHEQDTLGPCPVPPPSTTLPEPTTSVATTAPPPSTTVVVPSSTDPVPSSTVVEPSTTISATSTIVSEASTTTWWDGWVYPATTMSPAPLPVDRLPETGINWFFVGLAIGLLLIGALLFAISTFGHKDKEP